MANKKIKLVRFTELDLMDDETYGATGDLKPLPQCWVAGLVIYVIWDGEISEIYFAEGQKMTKNYYYRCPWFISLCLFSCLPLFKILSRYQLIIIQIFIFKFFTVERRTMLTFPWDNGKENYFLPSDPECGQFRTRFVVRHMWNRLCCHGSGRQPVLSEKPGSN